MKYFQAIPNAMEKAWKNNVELRRGLPLDYLKAVGFAAKQSHKSLRARINTKVKSLLYEIADYVNIDSAADQLGVKFLYDALPPVLTEGITCKRFLCNQILQLTVTL